jgi:hypothetical protein
MAAFAILERELRDALRRKRVHRQRFFAAAAFAGLTGLFCLVNSFRPSPGCGADLHQSLFVIGLFFGVTHALLLTAKLVSSERRRDSAAEACSRKAFDES